MTMEKTLKQVLMIIGMLVLSCMPAFLLHALTVSTSLLSPLESLTTIMSKSVYGGSVSKSFVNVSMLRYSGYPTAIVNGNFDYPYYNGPGMWMANCNTGPGCLVNDIDPNNGYTWLPDVPNGQWSSHINGFDQSKFGWRSTQRGGQGGEDRPNAVEMQKDYYDGNMYSEIVPYETDSAIYQDIATQPGAVYHWRIDHGAQSTLQNYDCTEVIIGGTVQQAKRTVSNGFGDQTGEVGTRICTKVTNPSINGISHTSRNHHGQWERYEGDYMVPPNQNVTRFSFKSLIKDHQGNIIDNIAFDINYPLRYHINGGWCSNGGDEASCMPVTGKVGNFYHNYYPSGTNVQLAGNGGSPDSGWQSNSIKRDGYVFAGWSSTAQDPNSFNGSTITNITVPAPGADVYAVWIPLTKLSWEKIDKITGAHVGGATFTITTKETDAKVTVVDNGDGDSDPRPGYISYNQNVKRFGHYAIQETAPPSGYFNDSDSAFVYADSAAPAAPVLKDTPKLTPAIRKYIEFKDDGYMLTLNFTGKQLTGNGGVVSMNNTVVKDTLTQWVDPADLQSNGTGASISATDANGNPTDAPQGTSVKYDAPSKTITWSLGGFTPIDGYTYALSFKIKATNTLTDDATARQELTDASKDGPDIGDSTTGSISDGKRGWYTNTNATLTYDAKYTSGTQANNKWDATNVNGSTTTKTNGAELPNGIYSIGPEENPAYAFDVPGLDSCDRESSCDVNIFYGTTSAGNQPSLDQNWSFINHDGYYTIMNGMGGCLDARGNNMADGTQIQQYPCSGDSLAQRWNVVDSEHDGSYMLVANSNPSYAASVYYGSTSPDTPIRLKRTDSNDISQRFMMSPSKADMNVNTSKTYDISSNADNQLNFDSPDWDKCTGQCPLEIAANDWGLEAPGRDQGYQFIPQKDGGYVLKNGMGACLDAQWGALSDGTVVEQYACNGSSAQIWDLIDSDNRGAYLIVPFYNRSVAVSVYSGNIRANEPLKLKKTDTTSAAQQWVLSPRNPNTVEMNTPYAIRMAMNQADVVDVPGLDSCSGNDCNLATSGSDYRHGDMGYDQTWTFSQNSDGSYAVMNAKNQCMDVFGAAFNDGARIDAYACNGTVAQRWDIKYLNHSFILISRGGNRNLAMSVYSGTYSDWQAIKLKPYNTSYISERFIVNPLSDLNTNVNIANQSSGAFNIGVSNGAIEMTGTNDRNAQIRMLNWLGSAGNNVYELQIGSTAQCIRETSTNDNSSVDIGGCNISDGSMAWQPVYYNGHWMFRNVASGRFMKANQTPVVNGTTLSIASLMELGFYANAGTLTYKKPVVLGFRWWYKDTKDTTVAHFYDAGSDNKDQSQKVFSCAAYVLESYQGTDGYTKTVPGDTKTMATDIANLKNGSLDGTQFTTWEELSHSINSPETQDKYNQIVAELQSACDSSNRQATSASTSANTPTLSADMQKAYAQGGTLLITRSKQNTNVSAPSKSMVYNLRPVDYIHDHYNRKLSIDTPGDGWHVGGDFSCGPGYTTDGNSNASDLYCTKVVVGSWQNNDSVASIKASYAKQNQTFNGDGPDSSYSWYSGARQFLGYYCASEGAWQNNQVDAGTYLNGCGTTSSQLAPGYDLNRTNIHLYHYMMLNILCDKTDFTSYYNKVKNYVLKNDSTYQDSGLSSNWQGSLISKPTSDANVVQFPPVTSLLSGIIQQNGDGTIHNIGTTGITAADLANNLKAMGVDSSSTAKNTSMMNTYLSSYAASKDPVYTKECPYSCVADSTLRGTDSISSNGAAYNTDRTGFYNRASDGKGAIIGDMREADAFSSIFYRNNAWNQVAMSVMRPVSSNGLTYNGTPAKTTTVLKNTTGTPWDTALGLAGIAPNASNDSMFYGNDAISNFISPTAQSIYEAPGNGTVGGEQNIFKTRAVWASSTGKPLKFDVSWEFDSQNAVNTPTTAGFGDNGSLPLSSIHEGVVKATSDGRCWFVSKVSGYPSDTTTLAHNYSGFGSNVLNNADNPIFPGVRSGFNITFVRSSSE